jgi:ABC-type phosphate/phosphonate transport system substrate-binding protein
MKLTNDLESATYPFITCGMYAFTDELRLAWQVFFALFNDLVNDTLDSTIRFETDSRTLCDDHLFIGHTCGYPLMKRLKNKLSPFCVPVFDAPGCHGLYNTSLFIASVNSKIQSLRDSYRGVAAFNGRDSNSGMNVFRHAVALLAQEKGRGQKFFSHLIESGSHKQSLIEVAEGRADVSAIDSVSFALIADAWPALASDIRTIGYSVKTCGLPFVMPNSRLKITNPKRLTLQLNKALSMLPAQHRQSLRLVNFLDIKLSDYESILDLEQQSIEMSYASLI